MREELLSVGIDIGTSTTQLIFSKLFIENMASSYTVPRIVIVDKQIIYKSNIHFTPLLSAKEIDGAKIKQILIEEYKQAEISASEIDTGAVIITGETARKENAKEVLNFLSGFAGDFVVATAGPDLEGIIAGKGAGAEEYSKEHTMGITNFDIGGGTTNMAVFLRGEAVETGCMDVGGRLIRIEPDSQRITYIAPKIQTIIQKMNMPLSVGQTADIEKLTVVIDCMVQALEQSIGLREKDWLFDLLATNPFELNHCTQSLCFSGGVADVIYHDNKDSSMFQYGDIGILLGRAIQNSDLCRKFSVVEGAETIRATVVGAGTHTTEISGSTITYTKNIFPIKNLPIIKLSKEDETKDAKELAHALKTKISWFEIEDGLQRVAVALEGKPNPSFYEVEKYAKGIIEGMEELMERKLPLIIIVENDMAKVLGQTVYKQLQYQKDVICLDSIKLENGDYIDIGSPVAGGAVLPVVVKTLVFH